MKNIKYIILSLLFVGFWACEDDFEPVTRFASTQLLATGSNVNIDGQLSFVDMSQGVESRLWTFPGGDTVTVDSKGKDELTAPIVDVRFNYAGTYKIRLQNTFIVDTVSNLDTTFIVQVFDYVKADFTSDAEMEDGKYVVLAGEEIQFTSTSTGGADLFEWAIEGGIPESAEGEVINTLFMKTGTYNVTLTATRNAPAHSGSITKQVMVKPAPLKLLTVAEREDQVIQLQFNNPISAFTGEEQNFTVTLDGTTALGISSVTINGDESSIIDIVLSEPIYSDDDLTVSYTPGSISSEDGSLLETISNEPVLMYIGELVPESHSLDNTEWDSYWKDHNAKNTTFERSTENYYSGKASLHLKAPVSGGSSYVGSGGDTDDLIHINAEKTYNVSFWVYVVEKPASLQFRIQKDLGNVWGNNPQLLWTNFNNVPENTWTELSFTFNPADVTFTGTDTQAAILLQIGAANGYDIYFEDFSIQEVDIRP